MLSNQILKTGHLIVIRADICKTYIGEVGFVYLEFQKYYLKLM